MKLLLDTHALLWWLDADANLGSRACALIEDPANDICVSVASLWEIVIKVRIGRLEADIDEVVSSVDAQGMRKIEIRPAHLNVLARLPRLHKDPFDHMVIAQAMVEGATLMSEDRRFEKYPATLIGCSN